MNRSIDPLFQAFECVAQPIFFAAAGQIQYSNAAARRRFIAEGQALAPLLGDAQLPAAEEEQAQLTLCLPDGMCSAVVRPLHDGNLFFLQAEPLVAEGVQLQTLLSIARTLRSPLTNLFGAAGELFPKLEALEDPVIRRQMASINRALYQLMHLSCNLGDFTAAEQGQLRLMREKTELCGFFYDVFSRAQPLCEAAGARLDCQLPEKLLNAWIDRQKIERCVLNLISNAMRHSEQPPQILLRLVRSGRSVLVQVTCGQSHFTDAALAEAFTRYATDAPLPDPSWGAGFGLPLVRQIVQLHGGSVMLSGRTDGGAMAVFSLPLGEAQTGTLNSPVAAMDYAGGFRHELVELADVLPLEVFDSENVN